MVSVKLPKKALALFFTTVCLGIIKELPDRTSRNSRRFQFALKLFILVFYAACCGIYVMPISYHRTAEQQNDLYAKGRTTTGRIVTTKDGHKKRSKHQIWEAVDLWVLRYKGNYLQAETTNKKPYKILGKFWVEKLGGTHGGVWELKDYGHFEL